MKEKTSITLSKQVLADVDRVAGDQSRSAFIEAVLRSYFAKRRKAAIDARDLQILNKTAESLNHEAEDVLGYQAESE